MKALKYTAAALAASLTLAVAFVAFAQNKKSAHQNVPSAAARRQRNAVKPTGVKPTGAPTPQPGSSAQSTGAIIGNPLPPDGVAREKALFVPSDAFSEQAKTLYASGDLAGAEAACLNALNAAPVIQGRKQHVPFVADLLGQVYLKDGQYEKAIYWLQGARRTTWNSSLNLNLALAYLRLGDFQNARRHYSAEAAAKALSTLNDYSPQDLPGTDTPAALEASILMARGLDAAGEERNDEALADLQRANQLAPDNALVAYHCAGLLLRKDYASRSNSHFSEAVALYEVAAAKGHGMIADDAKRHAEYGRFVLSHPAKP